MMSGLSARYGDGDEDDDSSDSSMWSRCSTPQLYSPRRSPVHSAQLVAERPRSEVADSSVSAASESPSPSNDVFSSLSPVSGGEYGSLPSIVRRSSKHPRILQTALARAIMRESRGRGEMSRSMDEQSMQAEMQVTRSSPDLGAFQRKSRSMSAVTGHVRLTSATTTDGDRHAAAAAAASVTAPAAAAARQMSLVSPRVRSPFGADSRRRQSRIAKHLFTADASEPQLLSLRRFCDDYRTSCLQQSLTARRLSLDRMLSQDDADGTALRSPTTAESTSASDRLGGVIEDVVESGSVPASVSHGVDLPLDVVVSDTAAEGGQHVELTGDVVSAGDRTGRMSASPTDDTSCDRRTTTYAYGECEAERPSDALNDSVGNCVSTTFFGGSTSDEPWPDDVGVGPPCSDDDQLSDGGENVVDGRRFATASDNWSRSGTFDEDADAGACAGAVGDVLPRLDTPLTSGTVPDRRREESVDGDDQRRIDDAVECSCSSSPAASDELRAVHVLTDEPDDNTEWLTTTVDDARSGTPASARSGTASRTSSSDDLVNFDRQHPSSSPGVEVMLSDVLVREAEVSASAAVVSDGQQPTDDRHDDDQSSLDKSVADAGTGITCPHVLLNVDDEETWL